MSLKDTPPKKAAVICHKKNAKMTVETVETVVAAAPYAALIGHSQSALADCEEDVIQICHLLSQMENFPWCASPRAFQRYQI